MTEVVLSRLKTKKDHPISYQHAVQKPVSVMYDGVFFARGRGAVSALFILNDLCRFLSNRSSDLDNV